MAESVEPRIDGVSLQNHDGSCEVGTGRPLYSSGARVYPVLTNATFKRAQEPSAMDTSGGAVGVGPAPAPPSTFQVSQVRGSEAFLPSTAPTQVCEVHRVYMRST